MKTVTSIILTQVVVGLMAISAQATECKWSGLGADNNMNTPANWEGGTPPKSGDIVILSYANGKDTINPTFHIRMKTPRISWGFA